jgi:hypothetical protein
MKTYTNPGKLENLIHQAHTYTLLEPTRQTKSKYLRRALKAAKYALRTAWAALTTNLEPQGAL